MSNSNQEIEAKFCVTGLDRIKARLRKLEARLIQERLLETNIRFDLPGNLLRSEGRVLRLRQDAQARLTYKGASRSEHGALSRNEIEFVVDDFEKARLFLEALGYREWMRYEKYREVYEFNACHIMLDELPYGPFVEIEGNSVDEIHETAIRLGLRWDAAVTKSYQALFEFAKSALRLNIRDLSYENFAGIEVKPGHLGVVPADV